MSDAVAARRKKREQRRQQKLNSRNDTKAENGIEKSSTDSLLSTSDDNIAKLLAKNEDVLLNFVVKVNKVYQEKLNRPAPFMTFAICGMQSAGKSTIMERFMCAVLNIVQEGTGTRCPLDTTCIHDANLTEPKCELSGEELKNGEGENLTIDQVFAAITKHNKELATDDRFSTKALNLVYRANNVQNMRFVDTPGIISNRGQGKDNRADIQNILRDTMKKPNTKLCVLLEPKEFSTNPIIDFCDETFGGRDTWTKNAIFLMTKFDKQLGDSIAGSKANKFFQEFHDNHIIPHLVITPTLPKEDLPTEELFNQRKQLLETASEEECKQFDTWVSGHEHFLHVNPDDELLKDVTKRRIGFESAKKVMRQIMLEDTARRLPEVLSGLRRELASCQNQLKLLKEKQRFNDPREVKDVVGQILEQVQKRIIAYLDGDLETAVKFPEKLQTLDEELNGEEDSEWYSKEMNHFSEKEEDWRSRIEEVSDPYPPEIQAENRFLGGKQFQRALALFHHVLLDSLPDPYALREYVPTGAGYLQGGLQRENWERATTSIIKTCMKECTHPGINFLIKHVGHIFRQLFHVALEDVKHGEAFSSIFKLIPPAIETQLLRKYDEMLWELMLDASKKCHVALEPMYSTLDINLPTFDSSQAEDGDDPDLFILENESYVKTPRKKDNALSEMVDSLKKKMDFMSSLDSGKAKEMLKEEHRKRATEKKSFLPDERTAMITDKEITKVMTVAFKYMVALMEFNNIILRFQMNHYLYEGFKNRLTSFPREILMEDWSSLVEPDNGLVKEANDLNDKIAGLQDSLQEVQRIQAKF